MRRGEGAIFSQRPDSMGGKTPEFCFKIARLGFFAGWETGVGGVGCILEPLLRERERELENRGESMGCGGPSGWGIPSRTEQAFFFTEREEERCANIGDIFRGKYLGSPPFVTFVQENAGKWFSERLVL